MYRRVYEEYCWEVSKVSEKVIEILGRSLGGGETEEYMKEFFKGNESIMRLNYYPKCQKPEETLGTGPHCDPTSLTILHEDDVGGLQVYVDDNWHSIPPNPQAFVVNIGDTFMVILALFQFFLINSFLIIFFFHDGIMDAGSIKWDLQKLFT